MKLPLGVLDKLEVNGPFLSVFFSMEHGITLQLIGSFNAHDKYWSMGIAIPTRKETEEHVPNHRAVQPMLETVRVC